MHVQEFNLTPSRLYTYLLFIVGFLSGTIVLLLPIAFLLKCPVFIITLAYIGWITWRFCLLKASASIKGIRRIANDKWLLSCGFGEMEAELLGDSTVTRWVSVLRFREIGQRRVLSCVAFRDSLSEGNYRRLVVGMSRSP